MESDDTVSKETEFKEVNATIRHYSNMRFLAMPIFFTINGAILFGFQNEKIRSLPNIHWIIAALSFALLLFFASFEWRLHLYLEQFVEHVRKLKPDSFWSKRPGRRILVTVLVIFLYVTVASCWFWLALLGMPTLPAQGKCS